MKKVKTYLMIFLIIAVLLFFFRFYKKYQREYYPDGQLKLFALENFNDIVRLKYYYPNGSIKFNTKKVKDKAEFYNYVEYYQDGGVKSNAFCKNPKRKLFKRISFVDTLVTFYQSGSIHKTAQIDKSCKASGKIKSYYPNGELMLYGTQYDENYVDLLIYYSLLGDSITYTYFGDDASPESKVKVVKQKGNEFINFSYGFSIKVDPKINKPFFYSREHIIISSKDQDEIFSVLVDKTNQGLRNYLDEENMNFIRSMLIDGIDVIKMEKLQINKTQKIFEESYQITCDKYPNYEAVLVVCKSRRSNNYINLIYQNLIDEINLDEIEASLLSLKFID